jgi:hypothetical protein
MDLRLTIKAVHSLQSFSPDLSDEVTIYGEVLGVPVQLNNISPDLLSKLDELLYELSQQTQQPEVSNSAGEYVDYHMAADYTLGDVVEDD